MGDYVIVVSSRPAAGREEEYNDWYNNQHLADVLAQPGFKTARRYKISDVVFDEAMPAPSHPYVAFYHLTTDDPQKAVDEMKKNVETGVIGLTDAIELDFLTYCYEAASPQIEEQ